MTTTAKGTSAENLIHKRMTITRHKAEARRIKASRLVRVELDMETIILVFFSVRTLKPIRDEDKTHYKHTQPGR
jgi:hypothetical protein